MSHRNLRVVLWHEDPHCYWCNRLTTLQRSHKQRRKEFHEEMATVDHLYSRYHPFRHRGARNQDDVHKHVVLACARCNSHRGGFESKHCNLYQTNVKKTDPVELIAGTFNAMTEFFIKTPVVVEKIDFGV